MINPPIKLAPNVLARRLPGGAVLVHLETNEIFELNETAARVSELLQEGYGRDEIVTQLVKEFEIERLQATIEVEQLLGDLERQGLITIG